MIPHYSKIHNKFALNGLHHNREQLILWANFHIKEGEDFEKEVGLFILDWLDNKDFIITKTSGTTGKPKPIELKKQAMVNSAIATGDFFNINSKDKALHCLPCQFIAGKMMFVRALILGLELDLVNPQGKFELKKNYDFAAMVPLQVENNFIELTKIKKLIIGGAPPSSQLLYELKQLENISVYETYGMTETITHIAAKNIHDEYFKVLPNINIQIDERNCLVIDAPRINSKKIYTNDIVEIFQNNQFKWLGRIDNVINSGGVKLFPEQIEKKLESYISKRFFVTSEEDLKLGNKVVLVIESEPFSISKEIFENLSKYEHPKQIYFTAKFCETKTGKINREETIKKIRTAY